MILPCNHVQLFLLLNAKGARRSSKRARPSIVKAAKKEKHGKPSRQQAGRLSARKLFPGSERLIFAHDLHGRFDVGVVVHKGAHGLDELHAARMFEHVTADGTA